jgi:hypothetical protein
VESSLDGGKGVSTRGVLAASRTRAEGALMRDRSPAALVHSVYLKIWLFAGAEWFPFTYINGNR